MNFYGYTRAGEILCLDRRSTIELYTRAREVAIGFTFPKSSGTVLVKRKIIEESGNVTVFSGHAMLSKYDWKDNPDVEIQEMVETNAGAISDKLKSRIKYGLAPECGEKLKDLFHDAFGVEIAIKGSREPLHRELGTR